MRAAIMQPYFLPYAGYFQLITATDRFVLCDDFQYTRHGWMTRNRFLRDGKDALFSLPIKSDSQNKQITCKDFENKIVYYNSVIVL